MNFQMLMTLGVMMMMMAFIKESSAGAIPKSTDLLTVSNTVNEFSTALYQTTAVNETKNLICSPVSVSMVLSMTAFGARGETEKEMRSVLRLPSDNNVSKNGFQSLIDSFKKIKKVDLRLANKIFTRTGFVVKPEFMGITKDSFESEVEKIDFSKSDAASKIINEWCEKQTNDKIKDIVQAESVSDASMILINAVYFKGQWKKRFDLNSTESKPFFTAENTSTNVPMMSKVDYLNYGSITELNATFVELEYEREFKNRSDATSMIIILPNAVDGLKKAESNLNQIDFKKIRESGRRTNIFLNLPKFKIESRIELEPILEKMGMKSMFTEAANFTGISEEIPLKISKVVQKAFIEVNEKGSEASAASAVVAVPFSMPIARPEPINLSIDRPFMYAIVHGATNTILFQGHVKLPVN